jgi:hypothetical protein
LKSRPHTTLKPAMTAPRVAPPAPQTMHCQSGLVDRLNAILTGISIAVLVSIGCLCITACLCLISIPHVTLLCACLQSRESRRLFCPASASNIIYSQVRPSIESATNVAHECPWIHIHEVARGYMNQNKLCLYSCSGKLALHVSEHP